MGVESSEEWPLDYIVVVPHAWRDDDLWDKIQAEAQERIGQTLREMYAELLQQPLSPDLAKLVGEVSASLETPVHAC